MKRFGFQSQGNAFPIKVHGSLHGILGFCEKMQLDIEEHQTSGYDLGDHLTK